MDNINLFIPLIIKYLICEIIYFLQVIQPRTRPRKPEKKKKKKTEHRVQPLWEVDEQDRSASVDSCDSDSLRSDR